ncbi:D-sedoheptulose-7-phosphate isomerase [Oceanicoccus sagamiensis]|uniref:Phosphoheptose isomerase n=1 Tax=Oceanicoccus sagamiensis TaxID=716816 RepID=A0A1X9N9X1_9GAMM|nr:SIS domain-containing protein [Oceanicoccus sagamiensis]ARN74878.1 phosphoheptose isomerase [Oceanicoccus sagamiensis]
MDLDQHVIELFHSSIDTTMRTLDEQAARVSDCATLMVQCLLSENKILCCGEATNGALAQIFSAHLLNRFDYERPSLPAINLSSDATTITALSANGNFKDIFGSQVRALGQPGDVLFIISNSSNSGTTLEAIKAAHDREMIVICLSNQQSNDFSALFQPEDIELPIPSDNNARVMEAHMQVINYLSELIDQQLFGSH